MGIIGSVNTAFVRHSIVYGGIACVLVGVFALLPDSSPASRPLPEKLGPLVLRSRVSGDRAAAILNRMHGKGVTPEGNLIGLYSGPAGNATVYVSVYRSGRVAYDAYRQMAGRIALGVSAFTNVSERAVSDVTVSRCSGYGETHFFFPFQNRLYWLESDPRSAPRAIEQLILHLIQSPS
jgi:hypothetical protein